MLDLEVGSMTDDCPRFLPVPFFFGMACFFVLAARLLRRLFILRRVRVRRGVLGLGCGGVLGRGVCRSRYGRGRERPSRCGE